jgi:hypothetical protein
MRGVRVCGVRLAYESLRPIQPLRLFRALSQAARL